MHPVELFDECVGADLVEVRFLKLEGDSSQPRESRRVCESQTPDLRRSEGRVAIHVEASEVVTASDMDLPDRLWVQGCDVGVRIQAAMKRTGVKVVKVQQRSTKPAVVELVEELRLRMIGVSHGSKKGAVL